MNIVCTHRIQCIFTSVHSFREDCNLHVAVCVFSSPALWADFGLLPILFENFDPELGVVLRHPELGVDAWKWTLHPILNHPRLTDPGFGTSICWAKLTARSVWGIRLGPLRSVDESRARAFYRLAGYVAEQSAYHHGESSLQVTTGRRSCPTVIRDGGMDRDQHWERVA